MALDPSKNMYLCTKFIRTMNILSKSSWIFKSLYLGGVFVDMFPDGITWRSRDKRKQLVLHALAPFALLCGMLIKCYGVLCNWVWDRRPYRYKLAVVAIAKNESEYIEEWLAFLKVIGVDCVFLFDNDSTDDMKSRIQTYIQRGFVVYNTIHGINKQRETYTKALKMYGSQCRYMAFIDCDEFLLPTNPTDSVVSLIDQAFAKDRNAGGIGVNWAIYGSSGHKTKTPGLVMERFTYRCKTDFERNVHIKSIIKPACVRLYNHPHYPDYRKGFYGINFESEIIGKWYNYITEYPSLRINHYYTKSKEEWDKRRSLGKADFGKNDSPYVTDDYFIRCDHNDVKDELALHYVGAVKTIMKKYKQN